MQGILDFGIGFIINLQHLGEWLTLPMKIFSFLGTEEFYILILPIIYWCLDSVLGIQVGFILMVSGVVNNGLKMVFHGPRPYWFSSHIKALSTETSFGVPSGHSQNAVAIWGIMAARLRKWWGWLVAVLLMFLIGLSRLYLGVHFVHDVLAGWLIGGLLLWLTLHFWDPVVARIKKLRHRTQIIFAFIASLLLLLIALIPYVWLKMANWQPPSQWMEYAANAISLEGALTNAGTFFGLMAGLVWMDHLGWFDTRGSWWQLVLRYILGVAGVLILRYGLKYIFPGGETYAGYFFQYLRYALIGIWVTGAAPWLFLQLGLANRK